MEWKLPLCTCWLAGLPLDEQRQKSGQKRAQWRKPKRLLSSSAGASGRQVRASIRPSQWSKRAREPPNGLAPGGRPALASVHWLGPLSWSQSGRVQYCATVGGRQMGSERPRRRSGGFLRKWICFDRAAVLWIAHCRLQTVHRRLQTVAVRPKGKRSVQSRASGNICATGSIPNPNRAPNCASGAALSLRLTFGRAKQRRLMLTLLCALCSLATATRPH